MIDTYVVNFLFFAIMKIASFYFKIQIKHFNIYINIFIDFNLWYQSVYQR